VDSGTITITASGGNGQLQYSINGGTTFQAENEFTDLPAGTYNIIVKDENNCEANSTGIVDGGAGVPVINDIQTASSTCGLSNGSITIMASGNTSLEYSIDGGMTFQAENTFNNISEGMYSVVIKDENNCTTTGNANVGNIGGPTATATGTLSACDADNATAVALPEGGTAPYTYLWSDGQMDSIAVNLGAGTYTVVVTDSNNCSTTSNPVIIEDATAPEATVNTSPANCGESDGEATVMVTGGMPGYNYQWSHDDQQTGTTATGLPAGAHNVTVTDANQCSEVTPFIIGTIDGPSIDTMTTAATCGTADGTATAIPSGGTPGYTYEWDDNAANQTTSTATELFAGTYMVTVTDGNDCTSVQIVEVPELPSDVMITVAAVTNATCNISTNGSASVNATGGSVLTVHTYLWNTDPPQTNPTVQGLAPGEYTVTATDDLGCIGTATVTIGTELGIEAPSPIIGNVTCSGADNGFISVIPTGGSKPYSLEWSTGVTDTTTILGLSGGDYILTITDNDGCSVVDTFMVTEPAASMFINVEEVKEADCILNNGRIEISVDGGIEPYSYLWSHDNTLNLPMAENLLAGVYTVIVMDDKMCQAADTIEVESIGDITAFAMEMSGVKCFNDNNGVATASATGGTPPYNYNWENSTSTQMIADDLSAGIHNITITDAAGCSDVTTVTIATPDVLEVTASGMATDCNGGSLTAEATGGTGDYTFTWSDNLGTGNTLSNVAFGTYQVTVTDENNCSQTTEAIVEASQAINLDFTSSNTSCFNTNDGQSTVTPAGGNPDYTYLWDNGETSNPATTLSAGMHTVTVMDASGCIGIGEVNIGSPTAITAGQDITEILCFGDSGEATLSATGGSGSFTYEWSNGAAGPTATELIEGDYTVSITDDMGCSTEVNVTITQPDELLSTFDTAGFDCSGGGDDGSITVLPTGGTSGYDYDWSTGGSGPTLSGLTAGEYTVTVTDANGCIVTQNINTGEPAIISMIYDVKNTACIDNETGGIEIISASGGSAPYVYSLDGGAFVSDTDFNELADNLPAGTYEITVQDSNGCFNTETIVITEDFELTADLGDDISVELGESIELSVETNNTTDTLSYLWIPTDGLSCIGCPNPTVSITQTTTYQVLVSFGSCTATDEITVNVDVSRNVFIPNVFSPNNDGQNDLFMIYGGKGVAGVKVFKVYDRWGELIWENQNIRTDDPAQAWDGTFRGKTLNPAVYVYYAEVEFDDGQIIPYKGDVTLTR